MSRARALKITAIINTVLAAVAAIVVIILLYPHFDMVFTLPIAFAFTIVIFCNAQLWKQYLKAKAKD